MACACVSLGSSALGAQPAPQVVAVKTQLWAQDQSVCILVYNPGHEPLQLPTPYTPPSISEMFGQGVTEEDLIANHAAAVGNNVTFSVAYGDDPNEGFNDSVLGSARRTAFQFAAGIWAAHLQGPASISIGATMTPRGGSATSAILASAAPAQFWRNFTHAPRSNTFYPEALTEIISGSDPDTNTLDINVDFNSDVDTIEVLGSRDWYYGTDASPGTDFDFVTVTIHELCHGLGFLSSFDSAGQFGLGSSGDPDIFDRFLVNGVGMVLLNLPTSPSNVTGNSVFWNGLRGRFAYNNDFGSPDNVPIFAPTPWKNGSSLSHLDESTFTGPWDLETPNYNEANHDPDTIVMGILQDIGYSLPMSRYVDRNASGFEDGSSANPFNTMLEGINSVPVGGHLRILLGTYPGALTIDKNMTLHSSGGTAILGQ